MKNIHLITDKVVNQLYFFKYKPRCVIKPHINGRIYIASDKGAISFGENVRINSNLYSNPIGGDTRTIIFAAHGAKISIGANSGISNSALVARKSITIEENVLIGGDCKIYDTDFHSIDFEERMAAPDTHIVSMPVTIKEGAFIGAHSIILKGVTIGRHSVVGAGSVVAKDIPDYQVWAGNPAKFIKNCK